jgi:hypothetical protein
MFGDISISLIGLVAVWLILPPGAIIVGLFLKKPGAPDQFGPAPRRRKSIASAFLTVLRKTLHYGSRASRSEFWWYTIVWIFLVNAMTGLVFTHSQIAGWIVEALSLMPGIALGPRRLHDIGRSGWWQLCLLTGSGGLVLLVLWVLPSPKPEDTSIAHVFE